MWSRRRQPRCEADARRLVSDRSGVTAIEYALIGAFIAVAAVGAYSLIAADLTNTFNSIANQL
jgi:pilus assembly protein Flp/PilA